MLPLITKELAITPLGAGWLGAAPWIGNLFFSIPFGWWLSRYSYRRLMALYLFTAAGLVALQGGAATFAILLGAKIMESVTSVVRVPVRALLLHRWFPKKELTWANGISMGLAELASGLTVATAPFLFILLGGWRNTFYLFSLAIMLVGILWVALVKEGGPLLSPTTAVPERAPIAAVVRYKHLWVMGACRFGSQFQWSAFTIFFPTYLLNTYQVPLTTSGFVVSLLYVGVVVAFLTCGFLLDKVGRTRPMIWIPGFAVPILSLAMLFTSWIPLLAFLSFMSGFTRISTPIIHTMPFQLPEIKPREIAVASGLVMTMQTVGGIAGPLVAGVLYQTWGSLHLALALCFLSPLLIGFGGLILPEMGPKASERVSLEL